MFKKSAILLLILAVAAIAAVPTAVFAAIGVHDIGASLSPEGACAACHNVGTGTAATRGWGRSLAGVPTTGWYTQSISMLCWTCHSSGGGVNANDVANTALNASNHAFSIGGAPPSPLTPTAHDNSGIINSNLPYTIGASATALQCTSCHNVHNDQYRPFNMKGTIRGLCDTCHPGRNTSAVRAANVGVGSDNVSVHPVNVAMTETALHTNVKPVGTMDAAMKVAYAAPYVLGGKLTTGSTGNVTCETCHPVHGTGTLVGVNDLLAIDQQAGTATAPSSALCEGCHFGGAAGEQVGASGSDHPLDNGVGRTFYPTGVAIPTVWTQAASPARLDRGASVFTTAGGVTGTPRCSSCHDAHGGLGTKSLLRSPIPTAASGEWCWSCHTVSQVVPRLHHSNTSTLTGSQISCSGCHGNTTNNQTQWSAHNGFGGFANGTMGSDTNSATPANTGGDLNGTTAGAATFEFLCEYCHNPTNPTQGNTGSPVSAGATFTALPSRHGVSSGTQTHLSSKFSTIGTPAEAVYIQDANRTFNSYLRAGTGGTNNWGTVAANAGTYSGQNIYSKYANYGTGTPQNPQTLVNGAYMVCESCHNLLTNAGSANDNSDYAAGYRVNLLLREYADDGQGSAFTVSTGHTSVTTVGDGFCRGCHSSAVITAANLAAPQATDNTYVHYPAAHTVVTATTPVLFSYGSLTPYGRSTATLLTAWDNASCPNTSTADMSTASNPPGATLAPGLFTYPAANALNCDSCHRPHNADAQGTAGVAFANATQGTVETYVLEDGTVATANQAKTEACAQCHNAQIQCNY